MIAPDVQAPPNQYDIGTPALVTFERGGHATPPRNWRLVSHREIQIIPVSVTSGFAVSVPKSLPYCSKTVTHGNLGVTITTFWCSR